MAIAAIVDGLNVADFAIPWLFIPLDIVTVLTLIAIWGMRREFLLVLVPEMIPALNLFPTWVAVVLYLYFGYAAPADGTSRTRNNIYEPLQRH